MAGRVAHDFNNLLTVIIGHAELLETRIPSHDPAARSIAGILEASRQAALLTKRLLASTRRQPGVRGPLLVNDVLRAMEPLIRPVLGSAVEPMFRIDPEIGPIDGDESQWEQLVLSLAIVARDAMPHGGFLTLQTKRVEFAPEESRPENLAPGRYVMLAVGIAGLETDERNPADLSEPPLPANQRAAVAAMAEQCGGVLGENRTPEEGMRLELLFPCREAPPAAAAAAHLGILIVGVNPDVRLLAELVLTSAGYRVATAVNFEDALAQAEAADPPFELLLTDVALNGQNGRELAARIRNRHPRLAVVLLSGHPEESILPEGDGKENSALLQKPFTAGQLLQRIQHALGERTT